MEIDELVEKEKKRQKETLMMIPSENYTYPEVRKVVGSVLMHKYAEGSSGKRYYQGNEFIDKVETLAQKHVLEVFELNDKEWHVNVQPHSGCEANLIVYNTLLNVGDKIMSMFLPDGGHLSHGWHTEKENLTLVSKIYKVSFYHVEKDTQVFDYDKIENEVSKIRPKLMITGGTAYPRDIDYEKVGKIAKKVGAFYLADISHEAGLVAGKALTSPFPFADVVTFTTHKTLRGPRGAVAICKKDLAEKIDRSVIPGVQGGPHIHSIAGIAITMQKAKSKEFKKYARQTIKNAKELAENLSESGIDVVSGGTDKHLVLIDLRNKKINGWFAAWALEKAGIIVNRNTVPNDTSGAFYPSGLRLGTPALTVRGMKEKEMEEISDLVSQVLDHLGEREIPSDKKERREVLKKFITEIEDGAFYKDIRRKVKKMCDRFPVNLD